MKYELIDSGDLKKLEQVGPYKIIRPAAGAVWAIKNAQLWNDVDAEFVRFSGGDGKWKFYRQLPSEWAIESSFGQVKIQTTNFGHLGIFAEQQNNWMKIEKFVRERNAQNVLNLFAYTGGCTLAAANGGAQVVHLDASKTSVQWAKENAKLSGLSDHPIRWIVDDVKKFVAREVKRENKYNGVILDPPTYGKGGSGQTWKIETDLVNLLEGIKQILDMNNYFIILSSHSQGYTPIALENLLRDLNLPGANYSSNELFIKDRFGRRLPSGFESWCFNE